MMNFKQLIKDCPECITSGEKLKATLFDKYPEISKAVVNTLVVMTNCGIINEIQSSKNITELDKYNWRQKLEDEGLSEKAIETCFDFVTGELITEDVLMNTNSIKSGGISKTIQIGQTIEFGSYWQSADKSDGKTPIKWKVLAKVEDKALLISEFALDRKPFNSINEEINWKGSTLRLWLNDEFLNTAFSTKEQNLIQTTCIMGDKNTRYNTYFSYEVNDKIFILSIDEAEKYFNRYEYLQCLPTKYTKPVGILLTNRTNCTKSGQSTCLWWLRSPGSKLFYAAYVDHDGKINLYGQDVNSPYYYCVRPALWIKLDS